jgi:YebC/PmpR family DNA-binding regulatory protein
MGAQWKHRGRTETSAAKGRLFSKLAKELIMAAKTGGADPNNNPRLRLAIDAAKKASMPRDTLERAIKRGAGLLEPVHYELVTYEGFGPHQVPVIVECLTDNNNRTASNMRFHFRKGQLAASGGVSWAFKRLGVIEAAPQKPGADREAAAIEAGAQDVEPGEEGMARFLTEPADLDSVGRALQSAGWTVHSSSLAWIAKSPVALEGAARAEVESFLGEVDEDEDVQSIFVGLASQH